MKFLRNLFVSCRAGVLAICALFVLTGCETLDGAGPTPSEAVSHHPDGAPSERAPTADTIRIGEQLTIELLDINTPTKIEQTVGEDGTITLPLLSERIAAAGKKVGELQQDIQKAYVGRLYKRMTVNIKRENRFFWVKGEVKHPGQFVYTGDMTLLRALAAAGDFTEYAKINEVEVIRSNGKTQKVNAKKALTEPKKHDVPIYAGDTVNVRQKWL